MDDNSHKRSFAAFCLHLLYFLLETSVLLLVGLVGLDLERILIDQLGVLLLIRENILVDLFDLLLQVVYFSPYH